MSTKAAANDADEQVYLDQETLYFKIKAHAHGLYFYHGLNLFLIPLIAWLHDDLVSNRYVFVPVVAGYFALTLAYLAAQFFGKLPRINWLSTVLLETAFITLLCYFAGGFASAFKYLYIFLILYSAITLSDRGTYITAAISAIVLSTLFVTDPLQSPLSSRELIVFLLFIVAMAIASAQIASFVLSSHREALNTVVAQFRAGKKIVEQRNEIEEQSLKHRQLIEAVNAIPWEYDIAKSRFTYVGPQVVDTLGFGVDRWLEASEFLQTIAVAEDHEKIASLFEIRNDQSTARECEFRVLDSRGDEKWLVGSINVRQIETGSALLYGIFLDITQRKTNDQELDRYRERLEEMVEERTKTINEYASQLEKLTTEDALTGITNRRYFDREYEKEWRRTARRHEPLGVLMIDVDEFKKYNDHYGHGAGDTCLKTIAEIIQKQLRRAGDFVSRYGGEEFIVVVPGVDAKACVILAARILSAVEHQRIAHQASTVTPYVTLSIGVCSVYPEAATDRESVVENADKALYQAKKAGRNRSVLFPNKLEHQEPLVSNG